MKDSNSVSQTTPPAPKPRYEVRTDGYWSFIIDTATGRTHSHGYDLVCDADLEAERLNEDESSDGKP